MVIMVHACECVYSDDYSFSFADRESLWSVALISGLMRLAVPLFLMASSFLLLPIKGDAGTFFRRRFTRVAIPFAVWPVLYAVLPTAWGEWSWEQSFDNLSTVWINFNPRGSHLWFLYMLLGIYLIAPILSPWLRNVSRRQEEFYIGLWFLTTFSWHLHEYVGDLAGECWWNPYPTFYYVSGSFGLVLLAHYIRRYVDWGTLGLCGHDAGVLCHSGHGIQRTKRAGNRLPAGAPLVMTAANDAVMDCGSRHKWRLYGDNEHIAPQSMAEWLRAQGCLLNKS